jgi:hypothetical protein
MEFHIVITANNPDKEQIPVPSVDMNRLLSSLTSISVPCRLLLWWLPASKDIYPLAHAVNTLST